VVDEINKRSEGRIVVEHLGQSVLGPDGELMQQGLDGTLPMFAVGTSAFSQYSEFLEAVQLPFLITSYAAEYKALKSQEFLALVEEIEKELDIKYISFAENGIRHFGTVPRPIEKVEDLQGMKIRIVPNNMLQRTISALGGNPTPIPYTEVFSGLQNGVIDGEEVNITSAGSQKHYEVLKYISEIGMYCFTATYWMNGEFYRSLDPADFELIKQVFEEGTEMCFNELLPEIEANLRKECEEGGVKFNVIEGSEKQRFIDRVKPLHDEMAAKNPKIAAFIEMAQSLEK
jgi:tripartite ATP-independent transporter DctP family solute receptor